MEIVKRIARWALRKEFEIQEKDFKAQAELIQEYTLRYKSQEDIISKLREKVFGTKRVLLSQTMVQCIVQMLPDPNKAGCNGLTSSELKERNMGFVDEIGGIKYQHSVRFVQVIGESKKLQGLTIQISEYNINVFIPLRREDVSYEVFGVQTAIDTYFWDLYGAGIRMLSDKAFAMSSEFIRAQNSVLSSLREEGLL